MSHGIRIWGDNFYQTPRVLPPSWWESVDLTLSKALNGDGGGTWNPSAQIQIGGAGLIFAGPWTLSSGATLENLAASGKRFVLGDSDYIQLAAGHAGATRSIVSHTGNFVSLDDFTSFVKYNATKDAPSTTTLASNSQPRFIVPLSVHDGATLSQVVFSFSVQTSHSGVPTLPMFRVVQVDATGNVTPLNTTSAASQGFVPFSPTPASGAAWYAAAATQTFTYTVDAGVVIDTSKYMYFAEIIDETGANSQPNNFYFGATATFTNIKDQRPQ